MKKGDWVVCVQQIGNFTKGKKYQLKEDMWYSNSLLLTNDNGFTGDTSLVVAGIYESEIDIKFYFISIEQFREEKLKQLGI